MRDLQEKVQEFCDTHNLNTTPESRLIDVVSELGEVPKKFWSHLIMEKILRKK